MSATSVIPAPFQRPSPSVHRVGFSTSFTRLLIGSLALRPALLLFGNSRPRVTATPLPHATGAYGQLPGRDFNPLDSLPLLRTARIEYFGSDGHKKISDPGPSRYLLLTVSLDDSMAMVPELRLSRFEEVMVGARVSRTGTAQAQSGDLQGTTAPVKNSERETITVLIDEVVP
ncbi:MAG: c-type cytochrome biogenesis protein CcmI/CycH [Gammaproteobacteria bacterium]